MVRGAPSSRCLKSYLRGVTEVLSTILLHKYCHSVGLYAVEGLGTRLTNRLEMWQWVEIHFCLRYWKIQRRCVEYAFPAYHSVTGLQPFLPLKPCTRSSAMTSSAVLPVTTLLSKSLPITKNGSKPSNFSLSLLLVHTLLPPRLRFSSGNGQKPEA